MSSPVQLWRAFPRRRSRGRDGRMERWLQVAERREQSAKGRALCSLRHATCSIPVPHDLLIRENIGNLLHKLPLVIEYLRSSTTRWLKIGGGSFFTVTILLMIIQEPMSDLRAVSVRTAGPGIQNTKTRR